ncbi:unnamed protein product, partial [Thlaspi arvense]
MVMPGGTESVLGMSVDMCDIAEEIYISEKAFENMRNLLYIRFFRKEGLSYLPQLRLLQCDAYPHMFLPSRFRTECLVELNMSHSKLKTLWGDNAQFSNALCLRGNTQLVVITNYLIRLRRLRMIDISFCVNIVWLPKFPCSVRHITALNCESLQTLHGPFRNPSIRLNFTNCLKLDHNAQEEIHQSVYGVAILPGGQVPAYFTHRHSGPSVMVFSNSMDLSSFSSFKVCLVVAAGNRFKGCDTSFYTSLRGDPIKTYYTVMSNQPELRVDHICMFECVLPPDYDGAVATHLGARRSTTRLMKFDFNCHGCEVVECGVLFLEARQSPVPEKRVGPSSKCPTPAKRFRAQ